MLNLNDYRYHEAIATAEMGRRVNIKRKAKILQKFGRRVIGGAGTFTVAQFPDAHETLVTGNTVDAIASSDASDTQTIAVEGHTLDGSDLTFIAQHVTLTGQTPAALPIPLARCTRLSVVDGTVAAPSTAPVGTVRVFDTSAAGAISGGVPTNTDSIKILIQAGEAQTQKAQTAISAVDGLFITGLSFMAERSSGSANVDFQVQTKSLAGVWKSLGAEVSLRTGAQPYTSLRLFPWRFVRPNSDVRIIASATAACDVAAHWQGLLAAVRA